jgi:uncharacterized protein (TIGR03000 family)
MRLFGVAVLAAGLVGLVGAAQPPAGQPPAGGKVKSVIKVTVPNEKAELMIEKETMKTTGATREFETPDLEAGKKFEYTFTVKFAPNNYTTITRVKTVTFTAGDPIVVDLTKQQADDKAVIRFVPTPKDVADAMAKLAKVGKDDVVVDLGCGDGALVLAAMRAGAKKGIGIDLDPKRIEEAKENAKTAGVADKTEFRAGDVFDITAKDMADITVVMMYMSDELGALIRPKLLATLKPGTRIVSHRFLLGEWKPDQSTKVTGQEDGSEYELHLWTVTQALKDAAAKETKKDEPKKDK